MISADLGYGFVVSGSFLRPVYLNIGGFMYFEGGGWDLWFSDASTGNWGWVLTQGSPGKPPIEYWAYTDPYYPYDQSADPGGTYSSAGSYQGSVFYTGSPPSLGGTSSFAARGSLRGTVSGQFSGTPLNVTTRFDRWLETGSEQFYTYYADAVYGQATGTKTVGCAQWAHGTVLYSQSVALDASGHFSYGAVTWNTAASAFVLGSYVPDPGTPTTPGWWQSSSPPTVGASWTLTFTKTSASTVTGSDIELTWDQYVVGANKLATYVFESVKWG